MYRKYLLLTIVILFPLLAISQTKFGPSINIGFSFFDKTTKNLDIKGGVCPSFGVTMQNDINYWFSLKSSLLYSFSQIKTTSTTPGGVNDQIKGQFIDLIIAGRFSAFDDASKLLPYGVAGLGNSFNIVGKGAENYLVGLSFKGYVPYFTVGLGTGIKMTFLSQIDISLVYNRYLSPVFVFPDGSDARMNMVVLKLSGLF